MGVSAAETDWVGLRGVGWCEWGWVGVSETESDWVGVSGSEGLGGCEWG